MTRWVLAVACGLAVGVLSVQAEEKTKEKAYEPKCPISGKAAVKEAAVDYKGGKVYFCCEGCPAAFKKDPAKFAAKANEQLVGTGQAKQVACPLSGQKVDAEVAAKVEGIEVHFCCTGCQGKVEKAASDDERREMVFGDKAFDKGYKVGEKSAEKSQP
jgi:YHS domain-containing protein